MFGSWSELREAEVCVPHGVDVDDDGRRAILDRLLELGGVHLRAHATEYFFRRKDHRCHVHSLRWHLLHQFHGYLPHADRTRRARQPPCTRQRKCIARREQEQQQRADRTIATHRAETD